MVNTGNLNCQEAEAWVQSHPGLHSEFKRWAAERDCISKRKEKGHMKGERKREKERGREGKKGRGKDRRDAVLFEGVSALDCPSSIVHSFQS